jgi:hypothetical protein
VASHGVSACWACPAPRGVAGSARRAQLKYNAGSSAWHPVHETVVRVPVGTLDHGTATHGWMGEVEGAYGCMRAQQGGGGNACRMFGLRG